MQITFDGSRRDIHPTLTLPEFVSDSVNVDYMYGPSTLVPVRTIKGATVEFEQLNGELPDSYMCVFSHKHDGPLLEDHYKNEIGPWSQSVVDHLDAHHVSMRIVKEENSVFIYRIYTHADWKCQEHPEMLLGEPLGMYHCPACGEMQIAGIPHVEEDDDFAQEQMDAKHACEQMFLDKLHTPMALLEGLSVVDNEYAPLANTAMCMLESLMHGGIETFPLFGKSAVVAQNNVLEIVWSYADDYTYTLMFHMDNTITWHAHAGAQRGFGEFNFPSMADFAAHVADAYAGFAECLAQKVDPEDLMPPYTEEQIAILNEEYEAERAVESLFEERFGDVLAKYTDYKALKDNWGGNGEPAPAEATLFCADTFLNVFKQSPRLAEIPKAEAMLDHEGIHGMFWSFGEKRYFSLAFYADEVVWYGINKEEWHESGQFSIDEDFDTDAFIDHVIRSTNRIQQDSPCN